MGGGNDPDKLRDEAKEYVDDLPDETAAGRMVHDSGAPADPAKWQEEHKHQEEELGQDDASGS
jgi:hypothetical protein